MTIARDVTRLTVDAPAGAQTYEFASADEAIARRALVEEALSWIGTPFCDCASVKGPKGAVDCAMLMTRCVIEVGLVAPFDPRPYPPRWHLHRDEERFINFLLERLGAREIEDPKIGDIAVWQFGRTYSHGGIIINADEVVHAYWANRMVVQTRRDEPYLSLSGTTPRAVRYFDLWSLRR